MARPGLLERVAQKVNNLTQGASKAMKPAARLAAAEKTAGMRKGRQKCFMREVQENGELNNVLNIALETEVPRSLSVQIPMLFLRHHLPVADSDDGSPDRWKVYAGDDDSPLHYVKTEDGRYPTFMYMSPKTNFEKLGLLADFQRKQEIELSPGFNERRARHLDAKNKSNAQFEMGFSASEGGGSFAVGHKSDDSLPASS